MYFSNRMILLILLLCYFSGDTFAGKGDTFAGKGDTFAGKHVAIDKAKKDKIFPGLYFDKLDWDEKKQSGFIDVYANRKKDRYFQVPSNLRGCWVSGEDAQYGLGSKMITVGTKDIVYANEYGIKYASVQQDPIMIVKDKDFSVVYTVDGYPVEITISDIGWDESGSRRIEVKDNITNEPVNYYQLMPTRKKSHISDPYWVHCSTFSNKFKR